MSDVKSVQIARLKAQVRDLQQRLSQVCGRHARAVCEYALIGESAHLLVCACVYVCVVCMCAFTLYVTVW